jgi:hypothetical protein
LLRVVLYLLFSVIMRVSVMNYDLLSSRRGRPYSSTRLAGQVFTALYCILTDLYCLVFVANIIVMSVGFEGVLPQESGIVLRGWCCF